MKKKTKKSQKIPEQTVEDKLKYEKSYNKALKKQIKNMELRISVLENRVFNDDKLTIDEIIKKNKKQKNNYSDDDFKKEFIRKYHPAYKEEK